MPTKEPVYFRYTVNPETRFPESSENCMATRLLALGTVSRWSPCSRLTRRSRI